MYMETCKLEFHCIRIKFSKAEIYRSVRICTGLKGILTKDPSTKAASPTKAPTTKYSMEGI